MVTKHDLGLQAERACARINMRDKKPHALTSVCFHFCCTVVTPWCEHLWALLQFLRLQEGARRKAGCCLAPRVNLPHGEEGRQKPTARGNGSHPADPGMLATTASADKLLSNAWHSWMSGYSSSWHSGFHLQPSLLFTPWQEASLPFGYRDTPWLSAG